MVKKAYLTLFFLFTLLLFSSPLALSEEAETQVDQAISGEKSEEEIPTELETSLPRFKNVGLLRFKNDTSVMRASEKTRRIFRDRLQRRFPKVNFKLIDLPKEENLDEPLLLKQAQRIGEKYGVDALIDGDIIGFKITGGGWPSRSVSYPEVLSVMQIRIVETERGTILLKYNHAPKKPKLYPQSIRTEEELFGRVIRDIVDEFSEKMKKEGIFYEEEEEKE